MDEDAVSRLWRRTFHDSVLEGFDPGATYKPPGTLDTVATDGAPPRQEMGFDPTYVRDEPLAGDCERIEEIARGGMGIVYRARQKRLRREIALKMAIPGVGMATRERFKAEALVTANLAHPNIVPIYDLVESGDGEVALAMKLIGGMAWSDLMHPSNAAHREAAAKCDLEFHLETLLSLTNAVAFAHSRQVVHNDLKPENVMVGEFGEVLLMDWGLAVDVSPQPSPLSFAPHRSTMPMPCGTPSYMPPELAMGNHEAIGETTDVYLLGAILHEIVTGYPPHRGRELREILRSVLASDPPKFDRSVPKALNTICAKAMSAKPEDRFATVFEFQASIRDFLEHRESLAIAKSAQETLETTEAALLEATSDGRMTRIDRYNRFAEAVAGFQQALVLWDANVEAQQGAIGARLAFGRAALDDGDLGLAESQVAGLAESNAEAGSLIRAIRTEKAARAKAQAQAKIVRSSLIGALVLIVMVLAVGFLLITDEKRQVAESSALAEARLADIMRLADVKRLADLDAEADALWPATPANVPRLEGWLEQTEPVLARVESHKAYLIELRGTGTRRDDGAWTFDSAEAQWEHDTLSKLVEQLDDLADEKTAAVQRRLAFARTVKAHTIDEHASAWAKAIAKIANAPHYGGLQMQPILGLVPLGTDPASGLEEFAHYQTGAVPERDAGGRLILGEQMGVVLVLVPGGTFAMGARLPERRHPLGSANVDGLARPIEGPVHTVSLDPFLMGKYEFTQGQWLRIEEANTSAYKPGTLHGGRTTTSMHPVEQVRWATVSAALARVELELPTEAQWEYAARAGSTTTFWAGDDKRDMAGAMNIADRYCMEHGGPGSWRYETWLDDGFVVHAPVGSYRANGFGLHDTAGNVWEWCADHYGSYALGVGEGTGARLVRGAAPRLFRGGGFRASIVHARSADRYTLYGSGFRAYDVGFRAARNLPKAILQTR